jgi:hypothetical protein
MEEEGKFIRLTGMFRMEKAPNCTTGTVGGQWLAEFVETAQEALNTPGKSVQFSHWDNGNKPGTLNFRVVNEQRAQQPAPPPQKGARYQGGQGSSQRKAYQPYQKKQEIAYEEPLEDVSEEF